MGAGLRGDVNEGGLPPGLVPCDPLPARPGGAIGAGLRGEVSPEPPPADGLTLPLLPVVPLTGCGTGAGLVPVTGGPAGSR